LVGAAPRRVIVRHVLPNLFTPLATLAVLEFARVILAEAALSFLGLGIQYPGVTWGLDIARAGDHELFGNQWLIIYPGLLLSLTVLAVNLLSSWLRVMLDPQEREKRFASNFQPKGGAELRAVSINSATPTRSDTMPTCPRAPLRCSTSRTCASSSSRGAAWFRPFAA
jgi:hypothetical protein